MSAEILPQRHWVQSPFDQAYFVGSDFDSTNACTFRPAPSGIGVNEAYTYAVESVFGVQAAKIFAAGGGLQNRAPIEVVQQFAAHASPEEQAAFLRCLDDEKLSVLMHQIGPTWPEPTAGFPDFMRRLHAARDVGKAVSFATISSGHKPFITATFDAWGLPQPDIILAQEKIAELAGQRGTAIPVKPNRILMRDAYNLWRESHGLNPTDKIDPHDYFRMAYVGDDLVKDGGLAAGMPYYNIQPDNARQSAAMWQLLARSLHLPKAARD